MVSLPVVTEQYPFGAVYTGTRPGGSCPQGHAPPELGARRLLFWTDISSIHTVSTTTTTWRLGPEKVALQWRL